MSAEVIELSSEDEVEDVCIVDGKEELSRKHGDEVFLFSINKEFENTPLPPTPSSTPIVQPVVGELSSFKDKPRVEVYLPLQVPLAGASFLLNHNITHHIELLNLNPQLLKVDDCQKLIPYKEFPTQLQPSGVTVNEIAVNVNRSLVTVGEPSLTASSRTNELGEEQSNSAHFKTIAQRLHSLINNVTNPTSPICSTFDSITERSGPLTRNKRKISCVKETNVTQEEINCDGSKNKWGPIKEKVGKRSSTSTKKPRTKIRKNSDPSSLIDGCNDSSLNINLKLGLTEKQPINNLKIAKINGNLSVSTIVPSVQEKRKIYDSNLTPKSSFCQEPARKNIKNQRSILEEFEKKSKSTLVGENSTNLSPKENFLNNKTANNLKSNQTQIKLDNSRSAKANSIESGLMGQSTPLSKKCSCTGNATSAAINSKHSFPNKRYNLKPEILKCYHAVFDESKEAVMADFLCRTMQEGRARRLGSMRENQRTPKESPTKSDSLHCDTLNKYMEVFETLFLEFHEKIEEFQVSKRQKLDIWVLWFLKLFHRVKSISPEFEDSLDEAKICLSLLLDRLPLARNILNNKDFLLEAKSWKAYFKRVDIYSNKSLYNEGNVAGVFKKIEDEIHPIHLSSFFPKICAKKRSEHDNLDEEKKNCPDDECLLDNCVEGGHLTDLESIFHNDRVEILKDIRPHDSNSNLYSPSNNKNDTAYPGDKTECVLPKIVHDPDSSKDGQCQELTGKPTIADVEIEVLIDCITADVQKNTIFNKDPNKGGISLMFSSDNSTPPKPNFFVTVKDKYLEMRIKDEKNVPYSVASNGKYQIIDPSLSASFDLEQQHIVGLVEKVVSSLKNESNLTDFTSFNSGTEIKEVKPSQALTSFLQSRLPCKKLIEQNKPCSQLKKPVPRTVQVKTSTEYPKNKKHLNNTKINSVRESKQGFNILSTSSSHRNLHDSSNLFTTHVQRGLLNRSPNSAFHTVNSKCMTSNRNYQNNGIEILSLASQILEKSSLDKTEHSQQDLTLNTVNLKQGTSGSNSKSNKLEVLSLVSSQKLIGFEDMPEHSPVNVSLNKVAFKGCKTSELSMNTCAKALDTKSSVATAICSLNQQVLTDNKYKDRLNHQVVTDNKEKDSLNHQLVTDNKEKDSLNHQLVTDNKEKNSLNHQVVTDNKDKDFKTPVSNATMNQHKHFRPWTSTKYSLDAVSSRPNKDCQNINL